MRTRARASTGWTIALVAAISAAGCEDTIFDPPPANEGEALYVELWEAFDRGYAPFAVRGVDWDAALERHYPAPGADDDALFEAATSLLAELEDGDVAGVARCDHAAVVEAEDLGLPAGQLVHRLLQREVAPLADVTRQEERGVAGRTHHLDVGACVAG